MKKTLRAARGAALGLGIAFFPKCPLCWAAYLSMFGSFGISNAPYMKWLLPVLTGFLALHLFLVFKKVKEKGYGPFGCSLAGAAILLTGRAFFAESKAIMLSGMLLIVLGSLWNSFSTPSFNARVADGK